MEIDHRIMELPESIRKLLSALTDAAVQVFKENLKGAYLHGSAAMGCFEPERSDVDLLFVVGEKPSDPEKRRFMDILMKLSEDAPEKGIEMSVMRAAVLKPFVYPTPFELHYSETHRAWYLRDPEDYVKHMNGTDPDLAAHFMILYHRGICLYGAPVREITDAPDRESYLASIEGDIGEAADEIGEDPVYYTLNLLRVLAYKQENLILSKKEAGSWALKKEALKEYAPIVRKALSAYTGGDVNAVPGTESGTASGEGGSGTALAGENAFESGPRLKEFAVSLCRMIKETEMRSKRSWFLTEELISCSFDPGILRVRADSALSACLRKGRKAGLSLTEALMERYRVHEGRSLAIRPGSLYTEIRLHEASARLFRWFSVLFERLKAAPFKRIADALYERAWQIDCGEKQVDGNRFVFDLLAPVFCGRR